VVLIAPQSRVVIIDEERQADVACVMACSSDLGNTARVAAAGPERGLRFHERWNRTTQEFASVTLTLHREW